MTMILLVLWYLGIALTFIPFMLMFIDATRRLPEDEERRPSFPYRPLRIVIYVGLLLLLIAFILTVI